jgi:hypothetical protein
MKLPYASHRHARWAWRVLFAVVGVYVLYLFAGNVFLNTSLGPWAVNRKPEKFEIHWAGGSTWWPGRVAVSDVKLRGHVRRTEWSVQAEQASGWISLPSLLHKEFRMPHVLATGVSGGVERAATDMPKPVPRPGGWTLRFDRIVGQKVTGGVFDGFVLKGDGQAEFGFVKQMRGGPMEILPSTARFTGTGLSREGTELLREGVVDARFAMARHRSEDAPGIDKLGLMDAELALDGSTAGMDVALDADDTLVVKMLPGKGEVHARIAFTRGRLEPGSTASMQMPLTSTDGTGVSHSDMLQAALDVGSDMRLSAQVPSQAGGVLGLDADLRVQGNDLPYKNLASLLPRASGHVKGQWRFASLRWLESFFTEAPWLSLDGAGDAAVDVQVADGKIAPGSTFSVPEIVVVAEVMDNRIEGKARANGRIDAGPDGTLQPAMDIVMERFTIAANDNLRVPYLQGRDLRLDLSAGEGMGKGAAALGGSLRAHLAFKGAQFPDLRVYNRYMPNPHLRFEGGSGVVSGDLYLDAAGDIAKGQVRLAARKAQMRMAGIALRGNIDIDTQLRRADIAKRSFAVDGSTVKLDNISFSEPGGETRSGWWARIHLPRARMDWNKPLAVAGSADVTMKDVGFLLSLFSRQREYPKWVYKLIDSGQAQVKGKVQWRNDTLLLDQIDASNQRFDLLARMRLRGQSRTGSLYAKWGPLSMGVEMQGAKARFHPVRARQWYDAQTLR